MPFHRLAPPRLLRLAYKTYTGFRLLLPRSRTARSACPVSSMNMPTLQVSTSCFSDVSTFHIRCRLEDLPYRPPPGHQFLDHFCSRDSRWRMWFSSASHAHALTRKQGENPQDQSEAGTEAVSMSILHACMDWIEPLYPGFRRPVYNRSSDGRADEYVSTSCPVVLADER